MRVLWPPLIMHTLTPPQVSRLQAKEEPPVPVTEGCRQKMQAPSLACSIDNAHRVYTSTQLNNFRISMHCNFERPLRSTHYDLRCKICAASKDKVVHSSYGCLCSACQWQHGRAIARLLFCLHFLRILPEKDFVLAFLFFCLLVPAYRYHKSTPLFRLHPQESLLTPTSLQLRDVTFRHLSVGANTMTPAITTQQLQEQVQQGLHDSYYKTELPQATFLMLSGNRHRQANKNRQGSNSETKQQSTLPVTKVQ